MSFFYLLRLFQVKLDVSQHVELLHKWELGNETQMVTVLFFKHDLMKAVCGQADQIPQILFIYLFFCNPVYQQEDTQVWSPNTSVDVKLWASDFHLRYVMQSIERRKILTHN